MNTEGRYVVMTVSFFARDEDEAADTVRDVQSADFNALETAGFAVDAATIDGEELEWSR